MRSPALPALLLAVVTGGCTPLFTIRVQPTRPLMATSKRPVALESRRVRVVHLEEPTLIAGSSAPRFDAALAELVRALDSRSEIGRARDGG